MINKIQEYKILVVIVITLLLFGLNRIVCNYMYNNKLETYELYHTSIRPTDNSQFNYLLDTESGNILYNNKFTAKDTVSFRELKGNYLAAKKIKEKYTMHTRVVTYSCGKSTCSRVETYWSWDYAGTEKKESKNIDFANRIYKSKEFDFNNYYKGTKVKNKTHYYTGPRTRYYYKTIPKEINGSVFVKRDDNKIKDVLHKDVLVRSNDVKNILESTEISSTPTIVFNVLSLLIGIGVLFFIYVKIEEL